MSRLFVYMQDNVLSYGDNTQGWLVGLVDINTEKENVQERIADYLTDLLSIGFSGFRIDAAKHVGGRLLLIIPIVL